jgi:cytidylate kinase
MNSKKIIGLSGTNGAGKDTVGQLLADNYGFLFISVTDLLRTEAKKRNLPVEREVLRTISAQWRRESGLGVLVDKAVTEFKSVEDSYSGLVMASLRNPGEADRIHDLEGGVMVWIDADPEVRYHRVQSNKDSRGRHEEDNKTYEQFMAEEEAEMNSSGDSATLNMSAVKLKSDIILNNSYDDIDKFKVELQNSLSL